LLQAGAFKIGDAAGTLDNIVACKLYRPGCVGFVSKSGGMSNEMYNVCARAADGIYEGGRNGFSWMVGGLCVVKPIVPICEWGGQA
jgi:succinyl-CoA synthetase alpha subunit